MKTGYLRQYTVPAIETVSVSTEAGFAVSYDANENTEHLGSYEEETL